MPSGSNDEQGRHFTLGDAARKLDIDFLSIVESMERAPGRIVALDGVAEAKIVDIEVRLDRRSGIGQSVLTAQRNQLVLRVNPGYRGHIGPLGRAQLHVIGAPVGVDDEIGDHFGTGRLDQDVDLLGCRRPAFGVADDPSDGVAGSDRSGADELFAVLQRDVGHLSGRRIDLVERAFDERVDLHGIEVAAADRLNPSCCVGEVDALTRITRLRLGPCPRKRLELARQRQRFWQLHHLHRLGRLASPARPAARRRS